MNVFETTLEQLPFLDPWLCVVTDDISETGGSW